MIRPGRAATGPDRDRVRRREVEEDGVLLEHPDKHIGSRPRPRPAGPATRPPREPA